MTAIQQEFPLEKKLDQNLRRDFGPARGKSIFANYVQARDCLSTDILRYIVGREPSLTDHGVDHIRNVLENVELLLQSDIKELNAVELYVLVISVLFHDVGNLFGRKNHHKKIGDIYEYVRHSDSQFSQEKCLVIKIASAHTGEALDGSNDTLNDLQDSDNLYGKQVRSRTLAAILRLADELAEGEHRTSKYIVKAHGFSKESRIFHDYALVTSVHPDRGNGRLMLTYNLRLQARKGKVLSSNRGKFVRLMNFAYGRIVKLDEERKYTKHYAPLLEPYKRTSVHFNFHLDSSLHDLDIGDLTLSDKIIPGENPPNMTKLFPQCEPSKLWQRLSQIKLNPAVVRLR